MRDAIAFYQGMARDKLIPAGAQTDTGANFFSAFATGKIGITPSGSFAIGALNSQSPDLEYGVAPFRARTAAPPPLPAATILSSPRGPRKWRR